MKYLYLIKSNLCVSGPMGESFQDFEDESVENQPQNTELRQILIATMIYFRYIRIPYLEFLRRAQNIHYWII